MEDNGKYLRLFGTIFFSFIGFILAIVVVLLCLRVFFGVLSYVPGLNSFYTLFIICVPACLFISVFTIFLLRTRSHPSAAARWISYILFSTALGLWAFVLVRDLLFFFKHFSASTELYQSYDMIFLIANVTTIFLVGVVQALARPAEKGWMERKGMED